MEICKSTHRSYFSVISTVIFLRNTVSEYFGNVTGHAPPIDFVTKSDNPAVFEEIHKIGQHNHKHQNKDILGKCECQYIDQ